MSTSYLPSSCSTPCLKGRISVCSLKPLLLLSCLSIPACFHPRAGTLGDFSPRSRTVSLSPFTQRSATSRCLTSLLLSFKTKQTLIFSFSEPFLRSWDFPPQTSKQGTFLSHHSFLQAPNLVLWAPLLFLTQASVQLSPFWRELTLINLLSPRPLFSHSPHVAHHFTLPRGHSHSYFLSRWGRYSERSFLQGALNLAARPPCSCFLSASYLVLFCFLAGLNLSTACWQRGVDT